MMIKLLSKSLLRRKLVLALLLTQIAITFALIVNSSLLTLNANALLTQDTGLNLENSLIVNMNITSRALKQEPALTDLLERQLAGVISIDGVLAVGYINQPPMKYGGNNGTVNDIEDDKHRRASPVAIYTASTGVFAALGVKVLQGQLPTVLQPVINFDSITEIKDFDMKTREAIITESLAKRLYGDGPAVGHYTNHGRVIAVVSDFAGQRFSENLKFNLLAVEHMDPGVTNYALLIRTQPGMLHIVQQVLANKLRVIDSNIDILSIKTFTQQKNELYETEKGLAILLSVLSTLMLLVAMVSSYSNAFFHALRQQQEIGIKRALGASQGRIYVSYTQSHCSQWGLVVFSG